MKVVMQSLKMMLIAAIICCGVTSAVAQNNFTVTGKVILGGSGGVGVPNWNVKAVELAVPTNIYNATTDLNGNYQITIPNGGNIGPNKRWEVSIYDTCSLVFRKDTVQNNQGTISSGIVNFELNQCQNNMCGIGWQYTESNQVVTFSNSAFGAANGTTRYFWNFGDGSFSTDKNPIHTYQTGAYLACGWVFSKNAGNDFCIKFFCDSVFVNQPVSCNALLPDFSFTVSGNVATFTNLTQSAHPNDMLYTWKFGDGTTSNDKNPIHTYPAANSYNVCLIAKDLVNNCIDSICKQVVTSSAPPTCNANFGILSSTPNTITLTAPATVTFKDSSVSNTPGTGIATWLWKVNGTNVATTQNLSYTFTQPGTYTVCLVITTTNGCTDDYCKQITVLPSTNCAIVFNASQTPNSNEVVFQSTITSTNINAQPVSYQWTFGDGSGSPDANPKHTYTNAGNFYVCVQVAFTDGCTAQYCDSVEVLNNNINNCEAAFVFTNNGLNLSTYTFYDSSATFTPNNPITAWEWTVDNSVVSTQQNFTYTFISSGVYTVCLKITSLNGCTDTYCTTITVGGTITCNANFVAFPVANNRVEFSNTSLPSPAPVGTFFYWNFGDGSPVAQAVSPDHTYSQPGIYTVCMYLFNQNIQCYDTICKQVTVGNSNTNCTASFIYTVNGSTVAFNNTSTPGLNTNSYFWTFGDNTTATGINPTHTFTSPGTYQVCLTMISSNSNCTNSVCQTIVIGQSNSLHCISGRIFKGTPNSIAYPARVILIYYDDVQGTLTAVRYASTGPNGGYEFCNVPNGKYLVKAALTPNDPQYSNYLPTYYGNSLFWNYATSVTLINQNVQQIDIWLIAGNNQGGPGFVGGYVSQGANKMQSPGDALQDIQVMLLDMFDNPVQYIFTDEEGRWTFNNVAYGTYQVYAEVPGKETIPYIVTIGEQQASVDNIMLYVETEQIISSISEIDNIFNAGISVFPNPASRQLFVETNLKQQAEVNISISDIAGKNIFAETANIPAGTYTHSINIAQEKQGLYIMKIEYKGFSNIYKITKF